uniref:DUF721 domain-containing protein n=1 Tax=Desulfobacca acetoxidans TaxID=60893 RepID=A0A7C3V523_9BACT
MSRRKTSERPVAVKQVLAGILRPGDWQLLELRQKVRSVWEQAVPEALRSQARLVDLKRHELWVEAASSALVQELQFLKPKVLEALQKTLGSGMVREIHFTVGGGKT